MTVIEWHHIMDKQPENGQYIIQVQRPQEGIYPMCMEKYCPVMPFDDFLDGCYRYELPYPDYWWTLVSEFPFPDKL